MDRFDHIYGHAPEVRATAPGRVNLIGEHTDYNEGFVLPAAIPRHTRVELARRDDDTFHVTSAQFAARAPVRFSLDVDRRAGDWADYVRGMVWQLKPLGITRGADLRITSDIPVGSGLSSSAALLVALGRALREAYAIALDDLQLAIAARKAETDFVGAPVGIMDQMACALADTDHALLIDTRSLTYERVRLPASCALIVIDSGIRHSHATGEYRMRREECQRAATQLRVGSLRELTEHDRDRVSALPPPLDRRVRHVVTENARVLAAVDALRSADLPRVGALFLESHASMRDDFEVSIPQIDALVETARCAPGVYGARLTGGGFGGAIVVVADPARALESAETVIRRSNDAGHGHATILLIQRSL